MILLSRSEEIALLAIWKLKSNAYGVTIREQVSRDTGHEWSFGAIYKPLKKLLHKDFVKKTSSQPFLAIRLVTSDAEENLSQQAAGN